jgi:hypothetical protein
VVNCVKYGRAAAFALAFPLFVGLASAGTVVPDFSSFSPGTNTPLSYTDPSGVVLTFSSPNGTFSIIPTFFYSINGNALYDVGMQFYTLDITFSAPITDFATSFALDTTGTSGHMYAAEYLSGSHIADFTAASAPPSGYSYAEGVLTVTDPGGFDHLVITSDIGDFALGRDTAGTGGGPGAATSTPEPLSVVLSLYGLVALVAFKRRRAVTPDPRG